MRIIAGERRGHRIDGPKRNTTRPTSDLVRESLFNILREAVVGRVVVDLFAGTGALGLEALSRGAERAIFVELNRENVALIYRNLAHLRYEDRVRVLAADAYRWARSFTPPDDRPMVVLLDPPYREYEIRAKRVNQLLATLVRKLPAGSFIAVESGRALDDRVLPEPGAWDVRRYGGTQVAIRSVPPAGEGTPAPPGSGHEGEGEGEGGDQQPLDGDAGGPLDADS
jgi:16S rRNA (guanine966-N2)-methyltransferase